MFQLIVLIISIGMIPVGSVMAETGRYVRLELPGSSRILHIAEIKVFSGNTNVAQNKMASQTTTFSKASATRAVDGNTNGIYSKGSVAHTSEGSNVWWEVDLGGDKAIDRIEIYNRADNCCANRINPGVILLLDANKNLKWEAAITQTQSSYAFEVPATSQAMTSTQTVAPQSKTMAPAQTNNLLRNADFSQVTSEPLPDYWDLHHAAALKFIDLHQQYGIDPNEKSPVAGAKVVKVVNSESNYPFVLLMPKQLSERPATGKYVFSFYAKASVNNANLEFTPWWSANSLKQTLKLSTDWRRYSVALSQTKTGEIMQPILKMLSKSAYFISAVQLEAGTKASTFTVAADDGISSGVFNKVSQLSKQLAIAADNLATANRINAGVPAIAVPLTAAFEYNLYTSEPEAVLRLNSHIPTPSSISMRCSNAPTLEIPADVILNQGVPQTFSVPLSSVPDGLIACDFFPANKSVPLLARASFHKLPAVANIVRVNNHKGLYEVDGEPFRIIGMGGIGTWDIPPLWYFQDIKAHGFNTVFMTRQPTNGKSYNYADVDKILSHANTAGLKVVLGFAAAGAKPADLTSRLTAFTKLVEKYRDNPNVLGWYPLDEPAATKWTDAEIQDIYKRVKTVDPYRPVMVNWAYDGLPSILGIQPRGGLYATDIYSFDYYPFAFDNHRLSRYPDFASRAGLTAAAYGMPSHSWLQIYGGNDVRREPTPDELEYMAHISLIFNQMFSYWDTKSNSKLTWDRVASINTKVQTITQLISSDSATQLLPPTVLNEFIYSAWKVDNATYLFVANNDSQAANFSFDLTPFKGGGQPIVTDFYEGNNIALDQLFIKDKFLPYKGKVYKIF